MRSISDRSCTENQNTHFMFSNSFSENRAFCETMWQYMVQPDRRQATVDNTVRRMRIACWMTKARIHPEFVTVVAFPLQQWLRERA
jgi:hypothetical protein